MGNIKNKWLLLKKDSRKLKKKNNKINKMMMKGGKSSRNDYNSKIKLQK